MAHVTRPYSRQEAEVFWQDRSLTELVAHIEATHHAMLRQELPRIQKLLQAAADQYPADARLRELHDAFAPFAAAMLAHIASEERDLFPLCRGMEQTKDFMRRGSLRGAVQTMIREHDETGHSMEKLRAICYDYNPPATAAPVWKMLSAAMKQLEEDLHAHVHKENNLLALRALQI